MSDTVRFAIVGTGKMADVIVPDFHATAGVEATAVFSRTQERAEQTASRWGVGKAFSDYDALLADADIDAVYIASPHPMHLASAVQAMEAGKHVLVEKPAGMTAAEAREMVEAARRTDRFLAEAMWMTFQPSMREVLRLIADGAIGDVQHVQADLGRPFEFDGTSRMWSRELGAGSVLDMGVYPLSFIHAVLGVPDRVHAVASMAPTQVDAQAAIVLGFPGGQQGLAASSMLAALPSAGVISGSEGFIRVHEPIQNAGTYTLDRRKAGHEVEDRHFERHGAGYGPMLQEVGRAILDGRREHPFRTWQDTIEVQEIMDRVLEQFAS